MNGIIRKAKDKENPYAQIAKSMLNDDRITWGAKGILSYLIGKPDNWQLQVSDLYKHGVNGRDAVYSIINELIRYRYIERNAIKNDKTKRYTSFEYVVYEQSQGEPLPPKPKKITKSEPLPEKPYTENPDTGKPYTESQDISNTDVTKKDLTKDDEEESILTKFSKKYNEKDLKCISEFVGNIDKDFDNALIVIAMEKTYKNAKSSPVSYFETMINKWVSQGIKTLADLERQQQQEQAKKEVKPVKQNYQTKSDKRPGGNFNNYNMRKYDAKKLENSLLGLE